jgi:hypothetical protein
MGLADKIVTGEIAETAAIERAQQVIQSETTRKD